MSEPRLEALRRMVRDRPHDSRLRFGLAVELLNRGETREGAEALKGYLALAEDEGNAWARLGSALAELGDEEGAKEAYRRGLALATRRGHQALIQEMEDALEDLE